MEYYLHQDDKGYWVEFPGTNGSEALSITDEQAGMLLDGEDIDDVISNP
ncbi:hypothetical protein PQC39_gp060 [Vibrio phage Vp_R1]|uniref:Uncharacterized protein n=1 Tax=Vibrio phage Vp_R1 TaxID=2059867 RepID=A0A2H5BQ17_9CAUD|nr:hypothetical protein PQC39_gp060 [Vibrio phage Vp_R1]AUG88424.1 hypothetical protein VPR_060 [Vibrio phage Vp_R1]